MARVIPISLREQVIGAFERGEGTRAELAQRFGVGKQTITRWIALKRKTGSLEPRKWTQRGRAPLLTDEDRAWLRGWIEVRPDCPLWELREVIAEHRGKRVGATTVNRALQQMGLVCRRHGQKAPPLKAEEHKNAEAQKGSEPPQKSAPQFRYREQHRPPVCGRIGYPSDLTDAQWKQLAPLLEPETHCGRPWKIERRSIVNALMYMARTGCQWRYLPHEFPHWQVVARTYYRWIESGIWDEVNRVLRERTRERAGRKSRPTAGIVDSQSVKTTEKGGLVVTMGVRRSPVVNGTSW